MKKTKVIDIIKKTPNEIFLKKNEEAIGLKREEGKSEEKKIEPKEEAKKALFSRKEPAIIHKAEEPKEHIHHHTPIEKRRPERNEKAKFYILTIAAVILAGILVYLAIFILPRVEIKIATKKANWEYNNSIIINSKIAEIDVLNRQIPAAILSQKKNATIAWPATGTKHLEQKTEGIITIYNAYSSMPQILVAGTRFQSPEGKIFRLKEKIVVPGAKTEKGKIIASSVDTEVIADQAGETYNVGPISHFSIPGFLNTDKYEKFYGTSKDQMTGGFIGQGKNPTQDDIKKAKEGAEGQIKNLITSFLYSQIAGQNLKAIESGNQFSIGKENINTNADKDGNFSIYIEAEGSIKVFRESDLLKLMAGLANQAIGEGYQLKSYNIEYGNISEDQKNKTNTLPVKFSSVFNKPLDASEFRTRILGKSENDLKSIIFSSSNIDKADISFWPFWVGTVPQNEKRVKISVD